MEDLQTQIEEITKQMDADLKEYISKG